MTTRNPMTSPDRGKRTAAKLRKLHANDPLPASNGQPQAPSAGDLTSILLSQISPCPTNPRKDFDDAGLQELAASIRDKGVLQPILVRKRLIKVTLPNGMTGSEVSGYEIVAGERRFRAAKLAGLLAIPAIIRLLTDLEVLEVQVVENLQREDLSALEEAQGYQALLDTHGYTVEDLAAKVGKSKAYIYGTLKLCSLPERAKAALAAGDLPKATAQLIARIPAPKLREQAAKSALTKTHEGELPTYREMQHEIRHSYMIELKQAPFDQADSDLLPSAGACTTCPKRTGNNRTDFPDGRADICTDPTCYETKDAAYTKMRIHQARVLGKPVLPDSEAKGLFYPNGQLVLSKDYVDLDGNANYLDEYHMTYRQVLGTKVADQVHLAVDPNGKLHELLPKSALPKKAKAKCPVNDWQVKHDRENELKKATTRICLAQVTLKAETMAHAAINLPTDLMRHLIAGVLPRIWDDASRLVVKRRGLKKETKTSGENRGPIEALIPTLTAQEVLGLLAELVVAQKCLGYSENKKEILDFFGLDWSKAEKEAKADLKTKERKGSS